MELIKKADLDIQDKDGNTALMLAISKNYSLEIIELLIKKGANLKIKNKMKHPALDFALDVREDISPIVELLIKQGDDLGRILKRCIRSNFKDGFWTGNLDLNYRRYSKFRVFYIISKS